MAEQAAGNGDPSVVLMMAAAAEVDVWLMVLGTLADVKVRSELKAADAALAVEFVLLVLL